MAKPRSTDRVCIRAESEWDGKGREGEGERRGAGGEKRGGEGKGRREGEEKGTHTS